MLETMGHVPSGRILDRPGREVGWDAGTVRGFKVCLSFILIQVTCMGGWGPSECSRPVQPRSRLSCSTSHDS